MAAYLFFDESGNLDFSPNGSRHFCFGVLTLRDPGPLAAALTRLRYALLAQGLDLQAFHAAEDRQAVRDQVFAVLAEVGGFTLDFLVADKRTMHPALRDPFEFYCRHGHAIMEAALEPVRDLRHGLVIITDTLPLQRERKAVAKSFRAAIRGAVGGRDFGIMHHCSAAHAGLQAVDYCTWALQRKLRGDGRSYELIRPWVRSVWEASGVCTEKATSPATLSEKGEPHGLFSPGRYLYAYPAAPSITANLPNHKSPSPTAGADAGERPTPVSPAP